MTQLEKDLDTIVHNLLFPARYAKTFVNHGSSYPPYSIIKLDDTRTVLEIAVAGFKETDLNVIVEDSVLKVSGKKQEIDSKQYIHKGISTRAFERKFSLANDTKIAGASYADGILSINIEYMIPEEKKPNVIPINKVERMYLTEGELTK